MFWFGKPTISFFISFVLIHGTLISAILLVLRAQGGNVVGWFTTPLASGKTRLQIIFNGLKSIPAISTYAMIATAVVMQLTVPSVHAKWLQSPQGWGYFFGGAIALLSGAKLIMTDKWPLKFGGTLLIVVGFIAPLVLATRYGELLDEKHEEVWARKAHAGDREFPEKGRVELVLPKDGSKRTYDVPGSLDFKSGMTGREEGCVAQRAIYSSGPAKVLVVCDKGERPSDSIKWPFPEKNPGVTSDVDLGKGIIRLEVVSLSGKQLVFFIEKK
jgi:hypothetical protein